MTPQQQAQVDYILDRFDFDRVHRAMVALGWNWHRTEEGMDLVPSKTDLRRSSRDLLCNALSLSSGYMSSGGFVARRDDDGYVTLEFVIDAVGAAPGGKGELV